MKKYLFSIIVTVYNKESTIKRCLESILKNEDDDYEIIIINDGSNDNSLKIIKEYKEKFSNIRIINQNKKGIATIRKDICSYVSGEYILFVDGDDSINDKLIVNLKKCISNYNPDIIRFDLNEINSIKNKNRYILN